MWKDIVVVFPSSFLRFALLLLPAAALLGVACTPGNPQSTFDAAGPVAEDQKQLFLVIFWLAVGVFVVVEGALILAILRFRRRPNQGVPSQVHGNRKLEIAWTIAPALVLVGVAIPTIDAILETSDIPEDAVRVEVTAHQWWWEFRYPDYDLVTANELHIPAGQNVAFHLESNDVIHSFWVPKLGGKTDVVPRGDNEAWLRANVPGTFSGQCAEFCGIAHAQMRFLVIAHPSPQAPAEPCLYEPCTQESFEEWVQAQQQPAVDPSPSNVGAVRGKEVFQANQCWVCHTVRGVPQARGKIGPDLTHFGSRTTLGANLLPKPPEDEAQAQANIARWLRDPDALKPGNIMSRDAVVYNDPAMALTEADVQELAAYLQSLK